MSAPLLVKISGRIMIVDDEFANVRLLERMLGHAGIEEHRSTMDPREALALCEEFQPDAVLLDLNMPHIDGITLLGFLGERFPCRLTLPILVLTADATTETKHRALQAGATDFLTKPLDHLELVLRLGNHLTSRRLHLETIENNARLEARVRERTQDLEEAQAEIIDRLSIATELRDDDTGGHVERVAETTARIARAMGLHEEEVDTLRRAVRLHDVGKISIPDDVLLKKGPLTTDEFAVMRQHADLGGRILGGSRFPLLMQAEQIARHHHERWDGGGYPMGLRGEAIPLAARIAAVADVFDALTSDRPYKRAWSIEDAAAEIVRGAGKHFDPAVVEAFQRLAHDEPAVVQESPSLGIDENDECPWETMSRLRVTSPVALLAA